MNNASKMETAINVRVVLKTCDIIGDSFFELPFVVMAMALTD